VLFAGPVLPRLGDAQRLVEVQALSAVRGGLSASAGLTPDQQVAFARLAQQLMP
jgi:hypothetical protein